MPFASKSMPQRYLARTMNDRGPAPCPSFGIRGSNFGSGGASARVCRLRRQAGRRSEGQARPRLWSPQTVRFSIPGASHPIPGALGRFPLGLHLRPSRMLEFRQTRSGPSVCVGPLDSQVVGLRVLSLAFDRNRLLPSNTGEILRDRPLPGQISGLTLSGPKGPLQQLSVGLNHWPWRLSRVSFAIHRHVTVSGERVLSHSSS